MIKVPFAPIGEPCPNDSNVVFVWLCEYHHNDSPINRPDRDKPFFRVRMSHIEDLQIVVPRLEQWPRFFK